MALLTKPGTRIAAEKPIHSMSCNIFVFNEDQSVHVETIEAKERERHAIIEPFLTLSLDEGQLLFDALYDAGYRRKNEVETTGEVAAQNEHIRSLKGINEFQCQLINRIVPDQSEVAEHG